MRQGYFIRTRSPLDSRLYREWIRVAMVGDESRGAGARSRENEMDALDVPVSRDHSINATARLTLTYALRRSTRYDTHRRVSYPPTRRGSPPFSLFFLPFPRWPIDERIDRGGYEGMLVSTHPCPKRCSVDWWCRWAAYLSPKI